MRAPLRLVAPWLVLIPAGVFFLAFAGLMHFSQGWDDPRAKTFATGAVVAAAASLGLYRAWAFHPAYRSGYSQWLATTPWDVSRPLPFGPIDLDWPDALPLGGLILAYAAVPGHQSVRIIAAYLFAHCSTLVPRILDAANRVPAYATLFGLGLMVRLWPHPWACAMTGVVVYVIVYDGLRISLRDFPSRSRMAEPPARRGSFDPKKARCGWPYDRLFKDPEQAAGGVRRQDDDAGDRPRGWAGNSLAQARLDSLMASLLLGWWASCLGPNLSRHDHHDILIYLTITVPLVGCLVRIAAYGLGYAQPISVWGRIRTGHWIIPGYDVMFLGPVMILATPIAVVAACLSSGVPWSIAGSIAPAATLFVALATPPGLRRWRLVGRHRLAKSGEETTGNAS